MSHAAGPSAVLDAELARIEQLLATDPAQAEAAATGFLARHPRHAMARLFLAISRRLSGNPAGAVEILAPLCESVPDAPLPHLQLGLALRETGERERALAAMRRAVAIKPDFADAWLALADLLHGSGDSQGADEAFGWYIRHSADAFPEVEAALRENRLADAERRLREHLQANRTDVRAMSLLADIALRVARYDRAESLLEQCLRLAPGYRAARHNYAVVLLRRDRPADALREVGHLRAQDPEDAGVRALEAAALQRLGDWQAAIAVYEDILARGPDDAGIRASLGHALRTVGRVDAAVDAYRQAAALAPDFGEPWWNLANLKTFRFASEEIEAMRARLAEPALSEEDRIRFEFALGKALEDAGEYAESFRHYAEGNRLRRRTLPYDAAGLSGFVERCRALFTGEFFAERAGFGHASGEPVFIVGLPRSGSTLVEQMLASHPAVEGTMELAHVDDLARTLAGRAPLPYPDLLRELAEEESRELGALYLERSRLQRKEATPRFLDKTPGNFLHVALIHLMLPNARIVDVRRHPMACGWSVFRHLFAHGHPFSYALEDIGRYYRDYVDLMAHFDAVLPGRVHRVGYEALVADTEAEVRRLLEHLGLPFDAACLRFFENPRAVSTPSSEQVRQPVFRDALDHWRHFERWLEPLRRALGGRDP